MTPGLVRSLCEPVHRRIRYLGHGRSGADLMATRQALELSVKSHVLADLRFPPVTQHHCFSHLRWKDALQNIRHAVDGLQTLVLG